MDIFERIDDLLSLDDNYVGIVCSRGAFSSFEHIFDNDVPIIHDEYGFIGVYRGGVSIVLRDLVPLCLIIPLTKEKLNKVIHGDCDFSHYLVEEGLENIPGASEYMMEKALR